MTRNEKRQMLTRQFVRTRGGIPHGRSGEGVSERHEQWRGPAWRLWNCSAPPSLQILYMNRQARVLINDLVPTTSTAQQPNNRMDILPPALINLTGEIISALRSSHPMSEKGLIAIRHSVNETGQPVSIRGVGVSNGHGIEGRVHGRGGVGSAGFLQPGDSSG